MADKIRILIVEDEVVTSIFLKMKLEQMGCSVIKTLSKGEDAINAVDTLEPELILMDINLGSGIDGIETVRIIKQKIDLPVIFITGYFDDLIVEEAQSVSPAGFLTKPLNYQELHSIIQNTIH